MEWFGSENPVRFELVDGTRAGKTKGESAPACRQNNSDERGVLFRVHRTKLEQRF